ncbi:hypothetical protein PCE1_003484 [Barthelona sp. PCE]
MSTSTFALDENRVLIEAKQSVMEATSKMKRAIEDAKLLEAVKFATMMTSELRVNTLSPSKYSELYYMITQELWHLILFFKTLTEREMFSALEIYEFVQQVGSAVPRMYLLTAAASCLCNSGEEPIKNVVRDLLEMIKCVQHPTKALFLRYWFVQAIKAHLPTNNEEDHRHGSLNDSLDFVLENFHEMNMLWVRMGVKLRTHNYYGGNNQEDRRMKEEKMQLRSLIGQNVSFIASIDGLSFELYNERVLPAFSKTIAKTSDEMNQFYLLDYLLHSFPAEYHINALSKTLEIFEVLFPSVKVNDLFLPFIDLLNTVMSTSPESYPLDVCVSHFRLLQDALNGFVSHFEINVTEKLELYQALLSFCVNFCLDHEDGALIEEIFADVLSMVEKEVSVLRKNNRAIRVAINILKVVFQSFNNIKLLSFVNVFELFRLLDIHQQRVLFDDLVAMFVGLPADQRVNTPELLEKYLRVFRNLLKPSATDAKELTAGEIRVDTKLFCCLTFAVHNDDVIVERELIEQLYENVRDEIPERAQPILIRLSQMVLILLGRTHAFIEANPDAIEYTQSNTKAVDFSDDENEEETAVEEEEQVPLQLLSLYKLGMSIAKALCGDIKRKPVAINLFNALAYTAHSHGNLSAAYNFQTEAVAVLDSGVDKDLIVNCFKRIVNSVRALDDLPFAKRKNVNSMLRKMAETMLNKVHQIAALMECVNLYAECVEKHVFKVLLLTNNKVDEYEQFNSAADINGYIISLFSMALYHFERQQSLESSACAPNKRVSAEYIEQQYEIIVEKSVFFSEAESDQFEEIRHFIHNKRNTVPEIFGLLSIPEFE